MTPVIELSFTKTKIFPSPTCGGIYWQGKNQYIEHNERIELMSSGCWNWVRIKIQIANPNIGEKG